MRFLTLLYLSVFTLLPVSSNSYAQEVESPSFSSPEAAEAYQWCKENLLNRPKSEPTRCICWTNKFIEKRAESGPDITQQSIYSSIRGWCYDYDAMSKVEYKYCMSSSTPVYKKTYGFDREQYCGCIKSRFFEELSGHEGRLAHSKKQSMQVRTVAHCRKISAYE